MNGPTPAFEPRLIDAAATLGISCSASQARTLTTYMSQLERWNRTYNLTALRKPEQILVQHIFDSLAVVAPMRRAVDIDAATLPAREQMPMVLDVGSGGGLPGVVVATMCTDWNVYCIDAVEKKMAFVRQMAGALQLPNLHAVHGRIEALEPAGADIVVSRAFACLADFARLAGAHVASDGHLLAMKGREPHEEITALERDTNWRVDQIEPLAVPDLSAERCLVWMSRLQGTP